MCCVYFCVQRFLPCTQVCPRSDYTFCPLRRSYRLSADPGVHRREMYPAVLHFSICPLYKGGECADRSDQIWRFYFSLVTSPPRYSNTLKSIRKGETRLTLFPKNLTTAGFVFRKIRFPNSPFRQHFGPRNMSSTFGPSFRW
jgi:hypothetical protein